LVRGLHLEPEAMCAFDLHPMSLFCCVLSLAQLVT